MNHSVGIHLISSAFRLFSFSSSAFDGNDICEMSSIEVVQSIFSFIHSTIIYIYIFDFNCRIYRLVQPIYDRQSFSFPTQFYCNRFKWLFRFMLVDFLLSFIFFSILSFALIHLVCIDRFFVYFLIFFSYYLLNDPKAFWSILYLANYIGWNEAINIYIKQNSINYIIAIWIVIIIILIVWCFPYGIILTKTICNLFFNTKCNLHKIKKTNLNLIYLYICYVIELSLFTI